jgi:hypothetical protein
MLTGVKDSILWVHILLQMLAFGVIFPTGMVLGVGSLQGLFVAGLISAVADHSKSMARTDTGHRNGYCGGGILLGTLT